MIKRFSNPNDLDNTKIKALIVQWFLEKLKISADDVAVEIQENYCNDAHCIHAETIISIKNTEGDKYFKIPKPLVFIRKLDIENSQLLLKKPLVHSH
jgi:hypothetical protein